jgi:HPt (histidine-containing phosphotransfer) domain-containing protein
MDCTFPEELAVLDVSYLQEISGGERELICEIVAVFREDVPPRIAAIHAAVTSDDIAEAARLAHALKGAAGSLGAQRLEQIAYRLEQCGKARQARECQQLLPLLTRATQELFSRLDEENW